VEGKSIRDPLTRAATGAPARRGHRARAFGFALLLAGLALACSAGSAFGQTLGHTYSSTFGEGFGTGNYQFGQMYGGSAGMSLAVDESGGYLYSTDTGNARIMKFNTSGEFLQAWGYGVSNGTPVLQICSAPSTCQAGITGAGPGQFEQPIAIAVDNSNGPNHGDVYVANGPTGFGSPENSVIKFSSTGTYLGKINDSESPGNWDGFPGAGPIAVDSQGFLWVAVVDQHFAEGGREAGLITKFSNEPSSEYIGGSTWDCKCSYIKAMTVNPAGTKVYLTDPNGTVTSYESDGTARSSAFGPGGFADRMTTDSGNSHLYVASDSTVHEFEPNNKEVAGGTFGPGHTGGAAGLAVDASTKNIYVADGSDATIDVYVPSVIPDVTTEPPTNVATTTATINGKVAPDPAGGGDVTSCSFQYMEKEPFDFYSGLGFGADLILEVLGSEVPCAQATPYTSQKAVSADISGLTMETAYTYRVRAANSNGMAKGGMESVTPHAVYGISTDPATDVSQTEATLHGSFDPKGDDTHYFFEWGTDTSYGNKTSDPAEDAGSTAGNFPAEFTLEGLMSFTTYHYRVVASNSAGTSYGLDRTFMTEPPLLPTVGPTTVTDLASSGATLWTDITPGYGDTVYLFEYGPTPEYGSATPLSESVGSDDSPHTVSTALTGLAPGTTYYARAVATNFGGTTHGTPTTFTTPSAPQIESAFASELAATTARLGARVSPGSSPTTVHFEYGTGPRYGLRTPDTAIGSDSASHELGAAIAGLSPGTTYHFRVVATNAVGTTPGPDQTFATLATSTSSPGGGQQTPTCDPSKLAKSAHRYAVRARQLRRRGLDKRAEKADRESKRLSDAAKRCRRNLRRAK
jgi:phosphodiesterase/alkaline phosphatase D-like protein